MNVIDLSFNPAGDEEPLWEMRQRQSKEQAKLLELQLIKQNKKIINDSIKKKKNLLVTNLSSDFGVILDSDNNTRMGTRTRERNNNSNSNSNSNSPTPSLQPR